MVNYNRYPAMDENNNFPPPVREALAKSPEHLNVINNAVVPLVIQAIADDSTILSGAELAAENAVEQELLDNGIVTGRVLYNPNGTEEFNLTDVAWRQTTDAGEMLPLGYTKRGRLDSYAVKIWSEDLDLPVKISTHPVYAKIFVTEKDELLIGIRWDGGVDIPGLANLVSPTPPPAQSVLKERIYQDAPYYPGSDIYPAKTDMKAWSGWGSSSMGGIATEISARAKELGVNYYNGGQGGEKSDHIAARLGSIPAKLTFPSDKIPASGSVDITSSNLSTSASLRAYNGWVTALDGTKVYGKISSTATVITFNRLTAGTEVAVSKDVVFIPEEGPKHRGEVGFLWMGKNNINDPDKVLSDTHTSYEYFVPLVKNVIVMGHFMNGDQPAITSTRTNLLRVNAELKSRYGNAYFDVQDYLTSSAIWTDTGITPTAKDLSEQAIGNKPPSISFDSGHMNAAGYIAVSKRLKAHIIALGWY